MKLRILGLAIFSLAACFPSAVQLQGGRYAGNLEECNRLAKDLCQSIACENHYRASAGRFPREVPRHCNGVRSETTVIVYKDAGAE